MNTLFIGRQKIEMESIDSTNDYASRLLQQKSNGKEEGNLISEGTLIVAQNQLKGKGQRGNEWESEPGKNLTFSVILAPAFLKPDQQFLLTKIISLGILDFLKNFNISKTAIKWPNDIYVEGKKIAGILIENTIRSNEIINSVVGIGININQENFVSTSMATSLKKITSSDYSPDECLEILCSCIEARYLKLKTDLNSSDSDYLKALYRRNEWKDYIFRGERIAAKIKGINSSGMLLLVDENQNEICCDLKEIEFT